MKKAQASIIQGTFYEINLEGLGEFKFLFSENKNSKSVKDKFFVESFWNPPNYGLVDHIVGYYCESIEWEINRIIDDMSYFIDGARVSCLSRIDDNSDNEGVYQGILDVFFSEDDDSFCGYDGELGELDCSDRECDDCKYYKGDDFVDEEEDFEIVSNDIFDEYYSYYGYPEFVGNVIHNFDDRDKYGLIGRIMLVDAEPSKRVYIKNENGDEFTVRYFISAQDENGWKASYTLYRDVDNGDGTGHGEMIDEGFAGARYDVSDGE